MKLQQTQCTCACKGKNLERFIQPVILSVLSNGSLNGYQIIKEIGQYATFDSSPDPAGVYRYLRRMNENGYLEQSEDGTFTITDTGLTCLDSWKATLQNYAESLSLLVTQL